MEVWSNAQQQQPKSKKNKENRKIRYQLVLRAVFPCECARNENG